MVCISAVTVTYLMLDAKPDQRVDILVQWAIESSKRAEKFAMWELKHGDVTPALWERQYRDFLLDILVIDEKYRHMLGS